MIEHNRLNLECTVLTTKRLVLRAPRMDDVDDITKMANNFQVAKNLGTMPYPYFDADAREFLQVVEKNSGCTYAITHADSGEMLGICSLNDPNKRYELPYIGYWLGENHWGQGYATEATRALVDLFFKTGSKDELMVSCHRENPGSRRVIEKCGGEYWKPGKLYSPTLGKTREVDHFRISRKSWMGAIAA